MTRTGNGGPTRPRGRKEALDLRVGRYIIREIGSPVLRKRAKPVTNLGAPSFRAEGARLKGALEAFRKQYGFGRAIAAPQVGISKRILAVDLGKGPFLMVNPEIVWMSRRKFTLWDDCMSFPGLMVRVRRRHSVSVRYFDEKGRQRQMARVSRALSELMQHELDHLDGILAVDRVHRRGAVISRGDYLRGRDAYDAKVDYAIAATLPGARKKAASQARRVARTRRRARRPRASSKSKRGRRSARARPRR